MDRSPPAEPAGRNTEPAAAIDSLPPAEPVYRPDDDRPKHDENALGRLGIRRYASRRLILFTDLPPESAESLPPLVDAVYDEWVKVFGELPPARDGSEYQLTGYLIDDEARFDAAGLVPDDLPTIHHGLHRGRRFWLREQGYDYYRRHLLVHETTHCFMTALPGSVGPVWYMEGMAEWFGTHRRGDDGLRFGVMPTSPEEFAGFGRITLVREEVAAGRFKSLDEVFALRPEEFSETISYAWSWAACHFLSRHPRYRDRFRELGDPRFRRRFVEEYSSRFATEAGDLAAEWSLFAHTVRYGYDLERAAVVFAAGEGLPVDGITFTVASNRGWQSSSVRVEAGKRYSITATGRFTLADEPKPWTSDANGISFDYFEGEPLGRLLAAVLVDPPRNGVNAPEGLLTPIDVGQDANIEVPVNGTLYFRLNDGWDRLGDNRGSVDVTIGADPSPPQAPNNGSPG